MIVAVGLLQGVGLGRYFEAQGLDRRRPLTSLLAFNIGVEIAVVILVVLVATPLALVRRTRIASLVAVGLGAVLTGYGLGLAARAAVRRPTWPIEEVANPLPRLAAQPRLRRTRHRRRRRTPGDSMPRRRQIASHRRRRTRADRRSPRRPGSHPDVTDSSPSRLRLTLRAIWRLLVVVALVGLLAAPVDRIRPRVRSVRDRPIRRHPRRSRRTRGRPRPEPRRDTDASRRRLDRGRPDGVLHLACSTTSPSSSTAADDRPRGHQPSPRSAKTATVASRPCASPATGPLPSQPPMLLRTVEFDDANYSGRVGWREIIVVGDGTGDLRRGPRLVAHRAAHRLPGSEREPRGAHRLVRGGCRRGRRRASLPDDEPGDDDRAAAMRSPT